MSSDKQALRTRVEQAVKALAPVERLERSARAQARLLGTPEFQAARTVMVYHSDATEVDTHEIVLTCLRERKRVGLPRTAAGKKTMQVLEILDPARDLEPSRFGFKEPLGFLPSVALDSLDLVVVPGRAFDAHGNRLGRGGGYYDRFFAQPQVRAQAAALAFDCQVVDEVPSQLHDRRVALVVTETRVIRP